MRHWLLLFALAGACGDGAVPPPRGPVLGDVEPTARSVILIVLDTLRADHTTLHGYERQTTPYLAKLAERAVVFERAYSNASWTRPSVATLISSRLPESHGCEGREDKLADEIVTLAELLKDNGYRTIGVTANGVIHERFGFAQGFDDYSLVRTWPDPPYADADRMREPVMHAVAGIDDETPFFLYLHYVDPHDPYSKHEGHDFNPGYVGEFDGSRDALKPYRFAQPPSDVRDQAIALYDAEIAWLDLHVQKMLNGFQRLGLLKRAWVVITSDHGEGLWDHQSHAHGAEVYEEQVRVPLMILPPGGKEPGARVDAPIALIDVAPTLLDLIGLPACPDFEGVSWAPFLTGPEPAPQHPIVVDQDVDTYHLAAIIDGTHKVIIDEAKDTARYFDLADDPGERRGDSNIGLWGPGPRLEEELRDVLRRAGMRRPAEAEVEDIPEELRQHLDALGYGGGN